MKKNFAFPFLMISLIFFSCKKNDLRESLPDKVETVSKKSLDEFIWYQLSTQHKFEWSMAEEPMIWAALENSDHILSVGYRATGFSDTEKKLTEIDIHAPEWKECRQQLLNLIVRSEQELDATVNEAKIIPWKEEVLPVFDVVVKNRKTLQLLLNDVHVRYAEPLGYEPAGFVLDKKEFDTASHAVMSSSGCGYNTPDFDLVQYVHFSMITPFAMLSWNYLYHYITKAWTKSTGAGIKVFLIDTGCELDQENLGAAFNQGASAGRTVEKMVTLPRETILGIPIGSVETPDDGCGHGTSMAGALAAPRGTDGNTCGVAYNCNLVTCRAATDVYLDESREVKGVSDAFTNAANRIDVKVISMSMGRLTTSSQLRDAVLYAYGKNKLIFSAAGTSFSWTSGWAGVIFPASLTEVCAVTGVRDNNYNTSCNDCHTGAEVDFTIVMERNADNKKPLSVAMSGDWPSTVGGSSVATATAAGIAALVWGRFPTLTRDQILYKLITTSSNYPYRSATLGWGNLNAEAAMN